LAGVGRKLPRSEVWCGHSPLRTSYEILDGCGQLVTTTLRISGGVPPAVRSGHLQAVEIVTARPW
jgi:hypothetical protein